MRTLFVLMALACNCGGEDDTGEVAWRPDLACPGDVGCESGDGELQAGASAVSITPTCFETWEDADGDAEYRASVDSYYDCGCDRLCEGDEGYPGPDDGEEDGEFQAVWMAGFQSGRPAMEVHDDMWARTLALRQGDTTVAIVSVDLVGYFHDDVLLSRALVEAAGTDVDHVMVTSTHQHEGPDTMGMWGRITGVTGYSEEYVSQVRAGIAQSVDEAVAALEPATLTVGAIDTSDAVPDKGTRNTVRDSRDPVIIDEMLYAALLEDAQGETIASMVHWGNHPEVLSDENNALTSDYAHYIREAMENGVVYDSYEREGLGGTSIYVQGMVGGLMTPLGVTVTDGEGVEHSSSDWEKAEALGNVIAELALDAIESGETVTEPDLAVRVSEIFLPVDNVAFQAMTLMGVFNRATFNYDTGESLSETNVPELRSEIDVIDLGPIRMLTVPGEMAPELGIGGYDGSHVNTPLDTLLDTGNSNPPDLDAAPDGPYLKDVMGAEYNWIVGLGNDEVGYILPTYDFKVHDIAPYLDEPEGDHYEETRSLGPQTADLVLDEATRLMDWSR